MFNINPKKMQAMMKQLGIKQEDIDAERVIIEKSDGKIIIEEPSVVKVNMQGQETFQISGNIREESIEEGSEEEGESDEENKVQLDKDIQTIMEKTGKNKEEVALALEKNEGDIAATILELGE